MGNTIKKNIEFNIENKWKKVLKKSEKWREIFKPKFFPLKNGKKIGVNILNKKIARNSQKKKKNSWLARILRQKMWGIGGTKIWTKKKKCQIKKKGCSIN